MALTGLQIFKLLPNTNCKECGFPTCLAFAMKLAAKQVELDLCPYASEEAKEILGAAAAPPIRLVKIGTGPNAVEVGEEIVMFRHDKTFYHPTAIAVGVDDSLSKEELTKRIEQINNISFERAGETLRVNLIAVRSVTGDAGRFLDTIKFTFELSELPLILISPDVEILRAGLEIAAVRRPLLYSANADNWEELVGLAKQFKVPLAVSSNGDLGELANLVGKIRDTAVEDIVLDPQSSTLAHSLRDQTIIRRMALEKNDKNFGLPTILTLNKDSDEYFHEAMRAAQGICKYASIILMENYEGWEFLPLLTLRQNIYTDPQKPLQVEGGIYSVGEPNEKSPVFVTTNFSLTYFIVSTEIDGAGVPSHLIIVDTEGMSVLTAWAGGKFTGEIVGKFIKESGIEERVSHRNIIIPGLVAVISGELEENLPGWNVMVGSQDAADIPAYLKEVWAKIV